MKRDPVILAIAAVFVLLLCVTALGTFSYLVRGYSLGIRIDGQQPRTYHISFPVTRIAVEALLIALGIAAIGLFAFGHRKASLFSWTVFAIALGIGAWDVIVYGTMGSPTSVWALLLFLVLALTAQFRGRFGRAPD